jgi:hypothetical protein
VGYFLPTASHTLVQGVSGNWFQSPFGYPPGVGESSPLSNTLWGFANLAVGFVILGFFWPQGSEAAVGWTLMGFGALVAAVRLSTYFGRVRSIHAGKSHARQQS